MFSPQTVVKRGAGYLSNNIVESRRSTLSDDIDWFWGVPIPVLAAVFRLHPSVLMREKPTVSNLLF